MEMGLTQDTPPAVCPACSAPVTAGAHFCSLCGTPLQSVVAHAQPPQQPPLAAPPPSRDPMQHQPYASEPAPMPPPAAMTGASAGALPATGEGMRQCAWCGALSAARLDRCAACGAVFPRPEMDAAVEQAAEQWMRSALGDLEARREKRLRRGLGRLFS